MGGDWGWLLLPFGAGYALIFWALSMRFPALPLALIFGLAPFQNDLSGLGGVHFSISEVHLLLCAPLIFFSKNRIRWNWMGGVLVGGLALTVFLTVPNWRDTSLLSLIQMGIYWVGAVAVFANLPRESRDFELAWKTLIVVGSVLSVAALVTRSSYFLGLSKNGIGASLACTLVVTIERWICAPRTSRWKYLPVLLVVSAALIMVLSRGAWLAALAGVGFMLAWRAQYALLAKLACAAVPVVIVVWMGLPQESREYVVGFDESRYNIHARTLNADYAREQWLSSPYVGVGAGLRKEYDATNVLWLTLAETGPLGLLAFLAVHASLFWGVWSRRRFADPYSGASSALVLSGALVLGKFLHGMVDHYWSRGAIMIAWASVGMALSVEARRAGKAGGWSKNDLTLGRIHRWPGRSRSISNCEHEHSK
jgi:hypothetical protein